MKQFSKDLGNVSLVPKGKWSREQEYERLALVYNACDNLSYVAKTNVPSGVDIENREYWQPMNVTGYGDNNFINLTTENENGTITAFDSIEEAVATIFPINRRAGATLSFFNLNTDRLDRQAEFELWQFNSTDLANWENKDYWNNIYYNWNVFVGWYISADALNNHVKFPNVGQYAYVGSNLNDAILYQCRTNAIWTNTGIKARNYISVIVGGNITIGENGNWFCNGKDTGIPATPTVDEQLDNINLQLQQHNKILEHQIVINSQFNVDENEISAKRIVMIGGTVTQVLMADGSVKTLGAHNGIATLDSMGNVPLAQLGNLDTTVAEVVTALPTTNIKKHIYLIKDASNVTQNKYEEYIYTGDTSATYDASKWKKLGDFRATVDLANYYTKSQVDSIANGKSSTSHTHSVIINGVTKTIAASGDAAVNLGTYLTSHQSLAEYAKKDEAVDVNNIEIFEEVLTVDTQGQKLAQAIRFHDVNNANSLDIKFKDASSNMNGFMSIRDKNKLDTIAFGATADSAITTAEIDALFA